MSDYHTGKGNAANSGESVAAVGAAVGAAVSARSEKRPRDTDNVSVKVAKAAHVAAQPQSKPPAAKSPPVEAKREEVRTAVVTEVAAREDGTMPWRCEACKITISVRADGLARTQHEAGAKHKKALERVCAAAT